MNKWMALLLVALPVALQFTPATVAAPQQQSKSSDAGLPWAYGFAMPATATPVPTPPAAAPAPAAPPATAEDSSKHLPGATLTFTSKQIDDAFSPADWFPSDHPTMPGVVAHGQKPEVRACGFCHYPNGKGRPNNASLTGLPAAYILQQLEDFRVGARKSWDKRKTNTNLMIGVAKGVTDEDAKAAADYFASIRWSPWIKVVETGSVPKTQFVGGGGGLSLPLEDAGTEPIGQRIVEVPANPGQTDLRDPRSGFIAYVPVGSIRKGEILVTTGGAGRTVGCNNCHGEGLKGDGYIPPLAGRSPSYLARQLYDFKQFSRTGPGNGLMEPVVKNLSEEDILDITAYVASLNQ